MIISHKHKFIFLKTRKTAGTSLEVFLSGVAGERDVVTEVFPAEEGHKARNFRGISNPFQSAAGQEPIPRRLRHAITFRRFYNHMPGELIRTRVTRETWNSYFKFCVERNPWDKTVSMYYMHQQRSGTQIPFDEFVDSFTRLPINYRLYSDRQGHVLVDRILRYESLDQQLTEVFGKLGVPFAGQLEQRAKGEYRAVESRYQDMYSAHSRDRVAEIYQQEIDLLGYEFE